MNTDSTETESKFGPWNPGVESTLPAEFLPLATLYRPENVTTKLAEIDELSSFSGIAPEDLVMFRPERLAVHELLIRVTADLSVPDGTKYEDLGTNFRRMTSTILSKHVLPRIDQIKQLHADLRRQASALIAQELSTCFASPLPPSRPSRDGPWLLARFGLAAKPRPAGALLETREERDLRIIAAWRNKAGTAENELERSTYEVLVRIASAVSGKRGGLIGDAGVLSALALPMVCNEYGSVAIGRHIEQYFHSAAIEEGYHLLPSQARPVVMNVKGASASGKSTMRPLQKQLAERLGIRWEDFALISTDIWRKFLLDYDSLGPARKYAGTLTGHEVAIIDRKLNRYMAKKAEEGRMSHLLIDRFRFDSFSARPDKEDGSGLLTRFGHIVYMFFMITPPEATVERAWKRGEQVGRYKAVSDVLYHNVEAYTGMPRLFFIWAGKGEKQVHFEFLDNGVPEGCRPRTVAFGTNGEMNILDVEGLLDVDRFKKINIHARRPDEVYIAASLVPEKNTEFLRQCARFMPAINFVDFESGQIYAKVRGRKLFIDGEGPRNSDPKAGLAAVAAELAGASSCAQESFGRLSPECAHTLGSWGGNCDQADQMRS